MKKEKLTRELVEDVLQAYIHQKISPMKLVSFSEVGQEFEVHFAFYGTAQRRFVQNIQQLLAVDAMKVNGADFLTIRFSRS